MGPGGGTRLLTDPMNIKPNTRRLEIRRQFFTVREVNSWNQISAEIKRKSTAASFNMAYANFQNGKTYPVHRRKGDKDE